MRFSFDTAITQNFDAAIRHEWLETKGLGGWAGSSIIGTNTRRYHGLLIAAMQPPGGRVVLLSRLDETIVSNGTRFELASNQYPGAIHPTGFKHQTLFEKGLFPVFEYSIDTIRLRKTNVAVHGENTTLIIHDVLAAREAFLLELRPFIAARVYHSPAHANESIQREFWYDQGGYLYDWVHGDTRDASIRPNQIFALSLPFPLLEGQQAKMVLETITKKLRTPFGLRSLAPDDPHYRPVYQGNGFERDSAYHQGTVWAWLLGPWITALVRFNGQEGKTQAKKY
jgi:glycogen debranching enzyme